MKKTLAAVAILGAFAGSAMADVTVYGRLDTGIAFTQEKVSASFGGVTASSKVEETSMDSGNLTGSRIGFKGSEKIGDNTFGFVLEGGVSSDTGAFADFKREATVFAQGGFGKIIAGRMGTVWSDAGSASRYAAIASVDGTGHSGIENKAIGLLQISATRYDNTIAYFAPKMGGVELFAQYAMGADGEENESSSDRYYAAGATYVAGGLKVGAVVEVINEESVTNRDADDTYAFHVGGQYDFGVMKASVAAVYFKDANDIVGVADDSQGLLAFDNADGYGVSLGVAVPVCGGTLTATAGYVDGEADNGDVYPVDVKAYSVGINYQYNLSKQVRLYAGAGYTEREFDLDLGVGTWETKFKDTKVGAGMVYYF